MNRIYKVIFNEKKGVYQVVSELVRSRGYKTRGSKLKSRVVLLIMLIFCLTFYLPIALADDGQTGATGDGTQTYLTSIEGGDGDNPGDNGGVGLEINAVQDATIGAINITGGDGVGIGTGGAGIVYTGLYDLILNGTSVQGGNGAVGIDFSGKKLLINNSSYIKGGLGATGIFANSGSTIILSGGTVESGNSFGYAITLDNSKLVLENGYTINGNVDATNGSILAFGGVTDSIFDASELGNKFLGFANIEKIGTSTWHINNTATTAADWLLSEGTLSISANGNLGTGGLTFDGGTLQATDDITLTNTIAIATGEDAKIEVDSGYRLTIGDLDIDIASLIKSGAGSLALGGDFAGTGDIVIGAGELAFTSNDDQTVAGEISGAGSLSKEGTGTLELTGTNTYTGGTTLTDGAISIDNNAALGTGGLAFDGGTLQATDDITLTNTIAIATGEDAKIEVDSGYRLTIGDLDIDIASLIKSGAGSLALGGDFAGTGDIVIGAGELAFTSNDDQIVEGIISGAGSLSKEGTGTLELTGTNTYTGGTTATEGTLFIHADENLGDTTGSLILAGGTLKTDTVDLTIERAVTFAASTNSTIETDKDATITFEGEVHGTGTLTKEGEGTLILSETTNSAFGGTIDIQEGRLEGNTTTIGSATIVNDSSTGILTFNQDFNGSHNAVLSGLGSIEKMGTGILELQGTNTYAGSTTIYDGTLKITSEANLGDSSYSSNKLIIAGGTLDASASAITVLSASRDVELNASDHLGNAATNTINTGTSGLTINSEISGNGGLLKIGAGDLELTDTNNSFTGNIEIKEGALVLASDATLGFKDEIDPLLFEDAIDPTKMGKLILHDDTTLKIIDDLNTDATRIDRYVVLDSGQVTIDTNGSNTTGHVVEFTEVISGNGGLVKIGDGELYIRGDGEGPTQAAYKGDTIIKEGQLTIGRSNVLSANGKVYLDEDTTLSTKYAGEASEELSNVGMTNRQFYFGFTDADRVAGYTSHSNLVTVNFDFKSGGSFTDTLLFGGENVTIDSKSNWLTIYGQNPAFGTNYDNYAAYYNSRTTEVNKFAGTINLLGGSGTNSASSLSLAHGVINADINLGNYSRIGGAGYINGTIQLSTNNTINVTDAGPFYAKEILTADNDASDDNYWLNFTSVSTLNYLGQDDRVIIKTDESMYNINHLEYADFKGFSISGETPNNVRYITIAPYQYDATEIRATYSLSWYLPDMAIWDSRRSGDFEITVDPFTVNTRLEDVDANPNYEYYYGYEGGIQGNPDDPNYLDSKNKNVQGWDGKTLSKYGTGLLHLTYGDDSSDPNMHNTYSGGTYIYGGVLAISRPDNLGTGHVYFDNMMQNQAHAATLRISTGQAGRAVEFDKNAVKKEVHLLTQGAINTPYSDTYVVMTNLVTGAGTLQKTGLGRLDLLNDTNDFEGGVEILGGTLGIQHDKNLGDDGNPGTAPSDIKLGGATLAIMHEDYNPLTNNTPTTDYSFTTERNVRLLEATGSAAEDNTFRIDGKVQATFTGTISENDSAKTVGIAKIGEGELILEGTNTYKGATNIKQGTLTISEEENLGAINGANTGKINMMGGTLKITDNLAFSADRNIVFNPGYNYQESVIKVEKATDVVTINGKISSSGNKDNISFVKEGAGKLILTNTANNYYNDTTVREGILSVSADENLGTWQLNAETGAMEYGKLILDGGTLEFTNSLPVESLRTYETKKDSAIDVATSGAIVGIKGALVGDKDITKKGDGILELSADNAGDETDPTAAYFDGRMIVEAGTLLIHDDNNLGKLDNELILKGGTLLTEAGSGAGYKMTIERNISLADDSTIENDTGEETTIAGIISGDGALTKDGEGTYVLSGINTYTGDTVITDGILSISQSQNLGDADNTVKFAGGTLLNTSTDALTLGHKVDVLANGGTISTDSDFILDKELTGVAGATLTKTGDSTLKITNTNENYKADTVIEEGTLHITVDKALGGDNAGDLTLKEDTVLKTSDTATINVTNDIILNKSTSSDAQIEIDNTKTILSGNISEGTTQSGIIKIGDGELVLTGNNTYKGTTEVKDGVLSVSDNKNLGDETEKADVILNGGALHIINEDADDVFSTDRVAQLKGTDNVIDVLEDVDATWSGKLTGAGGLNKQGTGKLVLANTSANDYTGLTTVTAGILSFSANNQLGTNTSLSLNGGTLENTADVNVSKNIRLDESSAIKTDGKFNATGIISGADGKTLTKAGLSELILTGSNTYEGDTVIKEGTVVVTNNNSFGADTGNNKKITLEDDTTLKASGDAALSSANHTGTYLDIVGDDVTLDVETGKTLSILGQISGNSFAKEGMGKLILSDTENNFSGNIDVNKGTLSVATNSHLGVAGNQVNLADAALELTDSNIFNRQLNVLDDGAIIGVTTGKTATWSGAITGSKDISKVDAGTLILGNDNSAYTGSWQVTAGTLSISDDKNLGAASSELLLNGGTLQTTVDLTSTRDIKVTADSKIEITNAETTLEGDITGADDLEKIGTGTLVLDNDNSAYTGSWQVTAGTLSISDDKNLGAASSELLLNGGTLNTTGTGVTSTRGVELTASSTIDTDGDLSLSGVITGSGDITKTGTEKLILSGVNTFQGNINVNAGTLSLSADNNLGAASNQVNVDNAILELTDTAAFAHELSIDNAQINVATGKTATWQSAISGDNGLEKIGAGTLVLTNNNNDYGDTTVTAGSLLLGADGAKIVGDVDVKSGANFGVGTVPNGNVYVTGDITMNSGSVLEVYSTATLNADELDLTAGNVTINISGVGGENPDDPAYIYDNNPNYTERFVVKTNNGIAGDFDTVTVGGAQTVDYLFYTTNKHANGNDYVIEYGLAWYAHNTKETGTFTLDNNKTFTVGKILADITPVSNNTASWGGKILTKEGAGTLILDAENTYTGGSLLNGGTIAITNSKALSIGNLTMASDTTLRTQSSTAFVADIDIENNIAVTTAATIDTEKTTTISGVISGTSSILKSGAGTLALTGANSFTGNITVGGTGTNGQTYSNTSFLIVSADNQLGNNSNDLIFDGGNLRLDGSGFASSRDITLNKSAIFDILQDSTLSGTITGIGGINKEGSGVLTLSNNANDYTGDTQITAGTVSISASNHLGDNTAATSGKIILSGGTLKATADVTLNHKTEVKANSVIDTNGSTTSVEITEELTGLNNVALDKIGDGELILAGANADYKSATNVKAGTLSLGSGNALGGTDGGILTLSANTELRSFTNNVDLVNAVVLNGANIFINTDTSDMDIQGIISGNNGFEKQGTEKLTLSSNNTFTGDIHVTDGTLAVASDAKLGNTTNKIYLGDAVFSITDTFSSARDITLTDTSGAGISVDSGKKLTLTQGIAGENDSLNNYALTKTGLGELVLQGDNKYKGLTTVSSGSLFLGADGAKISGDVTVKTGATFGLTDAFTTNQQATVVGDITLETNSTLNVVAGSTLNTSTMAIGTGTTINIAGIGSVLPGNYDSTDGFNYINHFVVKANKTNADTITGEFTNVVIGGAPANTVDYLYYNTKKFDSDADGFIDAYNVQYGLAWYAHNRYETGTFTLTNATDKFTVNQVLSDITPVTNDASWGGKILTKKGAGTLVLNAANTYTGATTVEAGKLIIGDAAIYDGVASVTSDVTVENGAVIGGNGTIDGNLDLESGANVEINASHGDFVVTGDIDFDTNNVLKVSGIADKSDITGTQILIDADALNGSFVQIEVSGFTKEVDYLALQTLKDVTNNDYVAKYGLSWYANNNLATGDFTIAPNNSYTLTDVLADVVIPNGIANWTGKSLNKKGAGTLVLQSANTYTEGTIVTAGMLAFDGGSVASSVTVENGAKINVKGSYTSGSVGGNIENSTNTAMLTMKSGSIFDYTGGETLKVDDIDIQSGSILNITGVTTTSAQTGVLMIKSDAAIGNAFSTITIGGFDGTVDYMSVNTYRSTMPNQSALSSYTSDTTGSEYWAIYGLSWYANNTTAHGTFTLADKGSVFTVDTALNDVSPQGSWTGDALTKKGAGTLILDAVNTYTGATDISAGTLIVGSTDSIGAKITSDTTVHSGAVLGGYGEVDGAVTVNAGGTLSVGYDVTDAIGKFIVDEVTFANNSAFAVNITDEAISNNLYKSDTLEANIANLNGGTVVVSADPAGNWLVPDLKYLILDANTLNGEFSDVTTNLRFLTPTLLYDNIGNDVYLQMTVNSYALQGALNTHNERQAFDSINSLDTSNPIYTTILNTLDDAAFRNYLDNISGEVHGNIQSAAFNNSRYINLKIRKHLEEKQKETTQLVEGRNLTRNAAYLTTSTAIGEKTSNLWAASWRHKADLTSDGNASTTTNKTTGIVLGTDKKISDTDNVGVAIGYEWSKINTAERLSSGEVDTLYLALYSNHKIGKFDLQSSINYGWMDIKSRRQIILPGLESVNSAKYKGGVLQTYLELSRNYDYKDTVLTPFVNMTYVNVRTKQAKETGGATALDIASTSNSNFYTTIGIKGEKRISDKTLLYGALSWEHNFNPRAADANVSFTGGKYVSVKGVKASSDALIFDLGIDWKIKKEMTLSLGYKGKYGSNIKDNGFNIQFNYNF